MSNSDSDNPLLRFLGSMNDARVVARDVSWHPHENVIISTGWDHQEQGYLIQHEYQDL